MFLAPAPQRHNPFLFPVWLKPAGECERVHGRPVVHMKALLTFLNLGQANPSHPAPALGVLRGRANLASHVVVRGQ